MNVKEFFLLFAENFEVPFSNNFKSKGIVAGCFRSDDDARYLNIRS